MAGEPERQIIDARTPPPVYDDIAGSSPAAGRKHGESFIRDNRPIAIEIAYAPDPASSSGQCWFAELLVKCDDVPRLMREGLHWDETNIIGEEGFIDIGGINSIYKPDTTIPSYADSERWHVKNHYFLTDSQHAPPLWNAHLSVYARDIPSLSRFTLRGLSRKNTVAAMAWSEAEEIIYVYENGNAPVNSVYPEMPLEGWWPRKSETSASQGTRKMPWSVVSLFGKTV
ncbi:hypothetical protein GGR50DRAFT_534160 [Xylaria sp. CBS 124048]|nr:hypothetical protein GGR50DRAFT_534160 [Xylaria sp. CBS 124048]